MAQTGYYHILFTGKVDLTCRPVYVKEFCDTTGNLKKTGSHKLGLITEPLTSLT